MGGALPLLGVILFIAVATVVYRRTTGVARTIDATFSVAQLQELGLPLAAPALLLFTAPGCPPCTVAKRVLDEVGEQRGLPVVVADVTEHHAIASAEHVYRAPTVFVVDERGHAISRISGVPRDGELEDVLQRADLLAA